MFHPGRTAAAVLVFVAFALSIERAHATPTWGNPPYHWPSINVQVVDDVGPALSGWRAKEQWTRMRNLELGMWELSGAVRFHVVRGDGAPCLPDRSASVIPGVLRLCFVAENPSEAGDAYIASADGTTIDGAIAAMVGGYVPARQTLCQEVGHTLGLMHRTETPHGSWQSCMNPDADPSRAYFPDAADLAQVRANASERP